MTSSRGDFSPASQVDTYTTSADSASPGIRETVYINVYDLHPYNKYVDCLGMGAYHAGIEIYNREYTFGFHDANFTGVFDIQPRTASGAVFKDQIVLGDISLSMQEVSVLMDRLRSRWIGRDYHVLLRNCNHFAEELVESLGFTFPPWLNRASNLFGFSSCCIPQRYVQPQFVPKEDEQCLNEKREASLIRKDSSSLHVIDHDDVELSLHRDERRTSFLDDEEAYKPVVQAIQQNKKQHSAQLTKLLGAEVITSDEY